VSLKGELLGRWDADRLHEVVSNLLSNALLYGATDHPVTLAARSDGPSSVVVDVTNRGPEVPASLLPLLFDPFRRGPGGERRSSQGLGLGLYIAREIVRAHHGEITVRSSAVEGTTFTVTLPRSAAAPDAAGPA
jgi:signal transduction histidine kinase